MFCQAVMYNKSVIMRGLSTFFFRNSSAQGLWLWRSKLAFQPFVQRSSSSTCCNLFLGYRLPINRPNLLVTIIHSHRPILPIVEVGVGLSGRQNFGSLNDGRHGIHSDKDPTKTQYYLQGYLKALEERTSINGYSVIRWGLVLSVAIMGVVYMFREKLKVNISDEVADVATAAATRSMENEDVMEKSKQFLREIINDPETLQMAVNFMKKVLTNKSVVEKAKELSIHVLNDPETREAVNRLVAHVLEELLENEELRKLLLVYVRNVIIDDFTKESCTILLNALGADPKTKQIMADFFKVVLATDTFTQQAVALGKNITEKVVTDTKIQEEAGSAFWTAVKKAIIPQWFL